MHRRFGFIAIYVAVLGLMVACGGTTTGNTQPTAYPTVPNGKANIRVFVFNDTNANGQADPNEAGTADKIGFGATPCGSGKINYVTTQADGTYVFQNLDPGSYCVFYGGDRGASSVLSKLMNVKAGEQAYVTFGLLAAQ